MTHYSPSPWTAIKHPDAGWDIMSDGNTLIVGDTGVQDESDAKLIAASPELLECLVELRDNFGVEAFTKANNLLDRLVQ
jgi:hypothetical protein